MMSFQEQNVKSFIHAFLLSDNNQILGNRIITMKKSQLF